MMMMMMMMMSMEHWWNDNDLGKPKYSEENIVQCHFVYHKTYMDCPGIAPVPQR